jgi:hypothetical protein
MEHFGAGLAGLGGKILFFHQKAFEPVKGEIPENARPYDTSAYNHYIILVSEGIQG